MLSLRTAAAAALLLSLPSLAAADVVGFSVGAYGWQVEPSGTFGDEDSSSTATLEDDLGLGDSESGAVVWAAIEHPVPGLPNLKLQYSPTNFSGEGTVQETFEYDGTVYFAGEPVDSSLDLDQWDVVLYWELLDNVVDLDVGINLKVLDGRFEVVSQTTGEQVSDDVTVPVPLLYANAGVNLPFEIRLGVEASGLSYDGSRLTDVTVGGRWHYLMLGVDAGYRFQTLVLDDMEGVNVDIDLSGPYLGASLDF